MRILVAEDDTVTRLALERMLQNEGHTVTREDTLVCWASGYSGCGE